MLHMYYNITPSQRENIFIRNLWVRSAHLLYILMRSCEINKFEKNNATIADQM
jgi:hypothetical protein